MKDSSVAAVFPPALALSGLLLLMGFIVNRLRGRPGSPKNVAARVAFGAQSDPVSQGMAAAKHALQAGIGEYDVALAAPLAPGG